MVRLVAEYRCAMSKPATATLPDRYYAKFTRGADDECWPWRGTHNQKGYGRIPVTGHRGALKLSATHVGWELHTGQPVPDGMMVCHHCDNPPCQNPAHWFLGTEKDNTADRMAKGRKSGCAADKNGRAKLTLEQVEEIRANWQGVYGEYSRTARKYGVSDTAIRRIILDSTTWKVR